MDLTLEQLGTTQELDLGASEWLDLEQDRIDAFAEATLDQQWIHTDPERAAATPFGGTIAHGYLLVSLVPHLFAQLLTVSEAEMLVNYGLDKVRFINPVPAGSRIRLEARIAAITPKNGNHLLRVRGNLVLDGETPRRAVVLESLFLVISPDRDRS